MSMFKHNLANVLWVSILSFSFATACIQKKTDESSVKDHNSFDPNATSPSTEGKVQIQKQWMEGENGLFAQLKGVSRQVSDLRDALREARRISIEPSINTTEPGRPGGSERRREGAQSEARVAKLMPLLQKLNAISGSLRPQVAMLIRILTQRPIASPGAQVAEMSALDFYNDIIAKLESLNRIESADGRIQDGQLTALGKILPSYIISLRTDAEFALEDAAYAKVDETIDVLRAVIERLERLNYATIAPPQPIIVLPPPQPVVVAPRTCAQNNEFVRTSAAFTKIKAFAYGGDGLNMSSSEATQYADSWTQKYPCDIADTFIADFKLIYAFAYDGGGLNMSSSEARSFSTSNMVRYCASAGNLSQEFKKYYDYAYSSSGLNQSSSQARAYAQEKVTPKFFSCSGRY